MIHYHGTPITPDTCALRIIKARHAFVSFAHTHQLKLVAQHCQSFALDNGAFSIWKAGKTIDWIGYYDFVEQWQHHPRLDFAVIPDVIGGSEAENDDLISEWPHSTVGVPVWHMNESIDRLVCLANRWPRVAIGSCAEYDVSNPKACLGRLFEALPDICNEQGYPVTKLHGLRMLNHRIFERVPLSSADSTNVARNIGIDSAWRGTYQPVSKETRAQVLVERIESNNSACRLEVLC